MEIYDRINQLLKENELSGIKLGEMLGLKKSPLTDWKNGKSKPTLEQVLRICDIFAISCDWLLRGTEDNKSVLNENQTLPEYDALYRMFADLPDEDKTEIYTYIKVRLSIKKEAEKTSNSKGTNENEDSCRS